MRPKQLEYALSSLQRDFPSPNVRNVWLPDEISCLVVVSDSHRPQIALEQYPTSPQLACAVILTALERGDVGPGRTVLDLGCGTGMLTTACALVESEAVLGVDCDENALAVAQANADTVEVEIDILLDRVKDVSSSNKGPKQNANRDKSGRGRGGGRGSTPQARQLILSDNDGLSLQDNIVDTVVTNPPFGTKNNAGMDVRFLRTSTRLARRAVYSFHKTSTRKFLLRTVESWGMSAEVIAEMKFDLPNSYKFHKQKNVDVSVDLLRVQVVDSDAASSSGASGDSEDDEELPQYLDL